jgi:hypothetical protein
MKANLRQILKSLIEGEKKAMVIKLKKNRLGMVVHTYNPSTWEAEGS